MWTARILLLALLLLTGGGWFDSTLFRREKFALLCLAPVVFGLSFLPTFKTPTVRLCFAPCAFMLLIAALCPMEHPFGALCAALLGGFLGWKLCDALPLFFEQGFLTAAPTLVLCALLCRDANARTVAIAAAPFVMLFFQMVGDYMLFKSAVLELGSGDAFCAQSAGLLALLVGGLLRDRLNAVRTRVRTRASLIRRT